MNAGFAIIGTIALAVVLGRAVHGFVKNLRRELNREVRG